MSAMSPPMYIYLRTYTYLNARESGGQILKANSSCRICLSQNKNREIHRMRVYYVVCMCIGCGSELLLRIYKRLFRASPSHVQGLAALVCSTLRHLSHYESVPHVQPNKERWIVYIM